LNIQFLVQGVSVYVIECNLRASRSLPFVCKATGVNLVEMVAPALLGGTLKRTTDVEDPRAFVVKAPQFSFLQMDGADPRLGVEMQSTGEVACFGATFAEALSQALLATGHRIPRKGEMGVMLLEPWQDEAGAEGILTEFRNRGIEMLKVARPSPATVNDAISLISAGKISFLLSFNANSNVTSDDLYRIRRRAVDLQVQIFSTREEAQAVLLCMEFQTIPSAS
jgi:carbamoyl-phosphate synthase large subunit